MLEKYDKYSTHDYLDDPSFIAWVKYSHQSFGEKYPGIIERYPHQKEHIDQARAIVLHLSILTNDDNTEDAKEIWTNIASGLRTSSKPIWTSAYWLRIAVAATVILMIGGGLWGYFGNRHSPALPDFHLDDRTAKNRAVVSGEKPLRLRLPDGSMVVLEKHSELVYPIEFNDQHRNVYLKGSAHFDVIRQPNQPFQVHSHEVITTVLGTSFDVHAATNDRHISISVQTGLVNVAVQNTLDKNLHDLESINISPNQQAIFYRKEASLVKTLVAAPIITDPSSVQMTKTFTNAKVTTIFSALEKRYSVQLHYDSEKWKDCFLTTTLQNETLFDRLNIICKAINAQYNIRGTQIYIIGNGC